MKNSPGGGVSWISEKRIERVNDGEDVYKRQALFDPFVGQTILGRKFIYVH